MRRDSLIPINAQILSLRHPLITIAANTAITIATLLVSSVT